MFIKWGLEDIPPLFFATLRYSLAFLILLVVDLSSSRRRPGGSALGKGGGALLVVAGLGGYSVAQGLQFVGLYYLPAVTTSFLLNFTPFFVLLLGVAFLDERASFAQLAGLGVAVVGVDAFFSERTAWGGQYLGVLEVLFSGFGWAVYVHAIRLFHERGKVNPLRLTTVTMGIGVAGMVAMTAASGEYANLSAGGVLIVVWLATANTALAFFLWNWVLKAVPPFELTVLQDLMLIEIALLSFVLLGEPITPVMVLGMGLVLAGVVVVQAKARKGAQARPSGGNGGADSL